MKPFRVVDNPVFGYLVENVACFGSAVLIEYVCPKPDAKRPIQAFATLFARGLLMVDHLLVLEKVLAIKVYSHVPYFNKRKPTEDLWTLLKDYVKCNFAVSVVNVFIQWALLLQMGEGTRKAIVENPPLVRVIPFMAKFVWCRVVIDVVFGVAHRFMHENKAVYAAVHSLHHEHVTPRTVTNFHFTWFDQFIEAVLPMYMGFGSLTLMGYAPSIMEQSLLAIPFLYYESASHTGKEVPIVTWIPFLSPLVDWMTGCDQRLIEYHTRHHQLYKCNYSISPWFDKMCGTYKIDLPKEYDCQASLE